MTAFIAAFAPSQFAPTRGSVSVTFGAPERVEYHLQNWRDWKRSGTAVEGYRGTSTGMSDGGSSQHFDDLVEASDRRCALITETLIADLPVAQSSAVHHAYLAAVFRFGRGELPALLDQARAKIGRGLAAKGVW